MHLSTEALVDIAEGTRPESAAPHLAACERCGAQVRELRAMMSAAQDVDVPEPSPLFWDHLSSRVSRAVAEEGARLPFVSFLGARTFQATAVVAVMALLIAVVLTPRVPAPVPASIAAPDAVADADIGLELIRDVTSDDDASLTVVASLTDDVDMETAREAGLAPRGSAEHAVTHMSAGELRELGRLLQEELARSGA